MQCFSLFPLDHYTLVILDWTSTISSENPCFSHIDQFADLKMGSMSSVSVSCLILFPSPGIPFQSLVQNDGFLLERLPRQAEKNSLPNQTSIEITFISHIHLLYFSFLDGFCMYMGPFLYVYGSHSYETQRSWRVNTIILFLPLHSPQWLGR